MTQPHNWEPVCTVQCSYGQESIVKVIPCADILLYENSYNSVLVISPKNGWRCLNCDIVTFSEFPGPEAEFRTMINGKPRYLLCGDIMVNNILGT